ncbi:MAG: hypothetical protein KDA63_02165, partial [Planctomycetales bacterium]|nr:hypothetical protein [Planctomycetales bacterium]
IGDGSGATVTDGGGNLIGTAEAPIDPLLGPLADNGGPTLTHALLPGSPAVDAGNPALTPPPAFDQRGAPYVRFVGAAIDIGAYEVPSPPMTYIVDTLVDESDGDYSVGDLSLREAIELANANPPVDSIEFDASLNGGTILLVLGQLSITDSVDITGPGADLLTIDASGNDPTPDVNDGRGTRIFSVDDGEIEHRSNVRISGLSLTGGDASDSGGAIRSVENLSLANSVVNHNASQSSGGAIALYTSAGGTQSILDSRVEGNVAAGRLGFNGGGGIFSLALGGSVTIAGSNVSDNNAQTRAGGIFVETTYGGATTIADSTISGNSTDDDDSDGGGIWALTAEHSRLTIAGCTIAENVARRIGGGVMSFAPGEAPTADNNLDGADEATRVTITGNTIADNRAVSGGGIAADSANGAVTLIETSTIAHNDARSNGGGIWMQMYLGGSITVTQCTVSENSAGSSGGISAGSRGEQVPTISHTTITANTVLDFGDGSVPQGGGIWGDVVLDHTIVAGNIRGEAASDDVVGNVLAAYSIIGDGSGATVTDGGGNLIGTAEAPIDPLLGPLADNGGPTLTHA